MIVRANGADCFRNDIVNFVQDSNRLPMAGNFNALPVALLEMKK